MQIDRIYYPVTTLGYGNRIVIWTCGCPHRCMKCSNPELWESSPEKEIKIEKIMKCIKKIGQADGVTITGGDPFFQLGELKELVYALRTEGYDDILIYTGYKKDEIEEMGKDAQDILENISVLVDGQYDDKLNDNKSIRGSSNQHIYIQNPNFKSRYFDVENWERKSQVMIYNGKIQIIGIPIKDNTEVF